MNTGDDNAPAPQPSSFTSAGPSVSAASARNMSSSSLDTMSHHQQGYLRTELECSIRTLQDGSQRDDLKLKALQDIWSSFDHYASNQTYTSLMESLVRCFLKLFTDTSPQFITENNTQILRKTMLEMLLRSTTHETMRVFTRQIFAQMVKVMQSDNEANAVLACKILIDHTKMYRMPLSPEVSTLMVNMRKLYNEMQHHVASGRMFEKKDPNARQLGGAMAEDLVIEASLQHCFYVHQVNLDTKNAANPSLIYQLIPRASQSVKVISESVTLVALLLNIYRNNLQSELMEFASAVLNLINLKVPDEQAKAPDRCQDILNDFHLAQVKSLNFLNHACKSSPPNSPLAEHIISKGDRLVSGILLLLESCPLLQIHQRRDILAHAKFFFTYEPMRMKFLPVLPRLFSERLMIGPNFTAQDNFRSQMYTQLADLMHHLRSHLSFPLICHSLFVFSRCLHDPQIPYQSQAMAARLVMNLCEALTNQEKFHTEPCRDILLSIMENFMFKMRSMVVYHYPVLFAEHGEGQVFHQAEFKPHELRAEDRQRLYDALILERKVGGSLLKEIPYVNLEDPAFYCPIDSCPELEPRPSDVIDPLPPPNIVSEDPKHAPQSAEALLTASWATVGPPMPLGDARQLVRCTMQSWKFFSDRLVLTRKSDRTMTPLEEKDLFLRMFKYGIQALDIYLLNPGGQFSRQNSGTGGRGVREEKEITEIFGACLVKMNPEIFTEIFSNHIDFLIERVAINPTLQLLCNTFLVHKEVSSRFGSIFISYLLRRLKDLGVNSERSNLYLRMFKLIFASIPNSPEIERMLRPHLYSLVKDATHEALRGKEPYNYFLLLRALFRSIGSGTQEVLYNQFLPLLPSLLSMLNRLQAGPQRVAMREIFVELCLTVPVRLSSLLPYLPLLMDPLVAALSGSIGLTGQGLRTLELCVDNLQPEYLYDHIAPVRAALMQGLWRTVASSIDNQTALIALRILGKFGGSNRKMLCEPQPLLSCMEDETDTEQMVATIRFDGPSDSVPAVEGVRVKEEPMEGAHSQHFPPIFSALSLSEVSKVALEHLKASLQLQSDATTQYSAELAKAILLAGVAPSDRRWSTEEGKERSRNLLQNITLEQLGRSRLYRCPNRAARKVYVNALATIAFAVLGKDLRPQYVKFFLAIIRTLTVQCILESLYPPSHSEADLHMDGAIIIDALYIVFEGPTNVCHAGVVVMYHICETAMRAIGDDIDKFNALPLMSHLVSSMCTLCHGAAWFARLGGACALHFFVTDCPRAFACYHMDTIVRALVEIIVGLSYEISSGTIELTLQALDKLHEVVMKGERRPSSSSSSARHTPPSPPTSIGHSSEDASAGVVEEAEKDKLLAILVEVYVPLLLSADPFVHETGVDLLSKLSMLSGRSLSRMLSSSRLLPLLIPSIIDFPGLSLYKQVATMTSVLFVLDNDIAVDQLRDPDLAAPLGVFIRLLMRICDEEDEKLLQRKQYQPIGAVSLKIPHHACAKDLKEAAMGAFLSCYSALPRNEEIQELQAESVLRVVMDMVGGVDNKLRLCTEKALKKAHSIRPIDGASIGRAVRQLVEYVESAGEMSVDIARKLCLLTSLDRSSFDRRAFDMTMSFLLGWDGRLRTTAHSELADKNMDDIETVESLVQMLALLPPKATKEEGQRRTKCGDAALEDSEEDDDMDTTQPSTSQETPRTEELAIDISEFVPVVGSLVASLSASYCVPRSTFLSDGRLVDFFCQFPIRTLHFFLAGASFLQPGRRALFKRIFEDEKAASLRTEAFQSGIFEHLLKLKALEPDARWTSWDGVKYTFPLHTYDEKAMDHELHTMWIIDCWSRNDLNAFANARSLIEQLQEIWNSGDFRARYTVRTGDTKADANEPIRVQFLSTAKFEVPKLMASCFIRFLRRNVDNLELFCDLMFVFIGSFATDMAFVRTFLKDEVIPTWPLWWRRRLFEWVMQKFEKDRNGIATNLHAVKIVQYALAPALNYAFDRYEVEDVVGPRPETLTPETENENLVIRLSNVLHTCWSSQKGGEEQKQMGDAMTLAIYHLCCVIVKYAYSHVHFNASKTADPRVSGTGTNGRLRVFMLFAWPCLAATNIDLTLKYMGHLFLAHIIERFSINRKIVLQVYSSLTAANVQDNRDIVRKAIDILTPAVPQRMDDGLQELLKAVKKALQEDVTNISGVFHTLQMVTRNYRSFFPGRHELMSLLMTGVNKLMSYTSSTAFNDGKRLAVEVCEMIIKWELMRLGYGETQVERQLEVMKNRNKEGEAEQETPAQSMPVVSSNVLDDLRPLQKEHADCVVNILLKIATSVAPANAPPQHIASTHDLIKRSLALLRACLKPQLWGETAEIKLPWLEKQLTIPAEYISAAANGKVAEMGRGDQTAMQQHLIQAQQTLETLTLLIQIMPNQLVLNTIRPLQKAITSCYQCSYPTMNLQRYMHSFLNRLFEKTSSSPTGLDDFEMLNQFLAKSIIEQFSVYEKSPSGTHAASLYLAFSTLRIICSTQPAYIDTMCLQPVVKVLVKVAREYTHALQDLNRDKNQYCDVMCCVLELLRPRVSSISSENKRIIVTQVLLPFTDTQWDKLVDVMIRFVHALILSHNEEQVANPGLAIIVKLFQVVRTRFRNTADPIKTQITKQYLLVVHYIYEHPIHSKTEYANKLQEAFYWGLSWPHDEQLRNSFLLTWEKQLPRNVFPRLMFLFAHHDWSMMKDIFWIRHSLYLLLKCAMPNPEDPEDKHGRVTMQGSAVMGAGVEFGEWTKEEGKGADLEEEREELKYFIKKPMENDGQRRKRMLSEILEERREVLSEASNFDSSIIINLVLGLIWSVPDSTPAPSAVFVRLFSSIWASLPPFHRSQLEQIIPLFISSNVHLQQSGLAVSSISVIIDALCQCEPKFVWNPSLIKYSVTRHRAWHRGLFVLEEEAEGISPMEGKEVSLVNGHATPELERQLDVLENLISLYSELGESDQAAGVWKKRAFNPSTKNAIESVQKGEYREAVELLEDLENEHSLRLEALQLDTPENVASGGDDMKGINDLSLISPAMHLETQYWHKMWTECSLHLARWGEVEEFANAAVVQDVRLLIRIAAHRPDPWLMMRQCKDQLSACIPPDFTVQYQMYSAVIAVMDSMGETIQECRDMAERECNEAQNTILRQWRHLPTFVASSHLSILQSIHLLLDLQEAASITANLHPSQIPTKDSSIDSIKNISKSWRFASRNPPLLDDVATTYDMLNVRKRFYNKISRTFEDWALRGGGSNNLALPTHNLVLVQLAMARTARSARLYDVSEHFLNLIHGEIAMPVMSLATKIVDHIKLLRHKAADPRIDPQERIELLSEASVITHDIVLSDLSKEHLARIYTQRGAALSDLGSFEQASECLSLATRLNEHSTAYASSYAKWAQHLDNYFQNNMTVEAAKNEGVNAVISFIEYAKVEQSQMKVRKQIARAIMTTRKIAQVSNDAVGLIPAMVERHARSAQVHMWIEWLPQLCVDLKLWIGGLSGFVAAVARAHPLHAFYALRQITSRQDRLPVLHQVARDENTNCVEGEEASHPFHSTTRYTTFPTISHLIELATEKRPSDVLALERLLSAVEEMREFWSERQLRFAIHLQQTVFNCLHNGDVSATEVKKAKEQWTDELKRPAVEGEFISERDVGVDDGEKEFITSFTSELRSSLEQLVDLMALSEQVCKWRRRLEERLERLPKMLPLRLASPLLSEFCAQTANVDMFSELYTVRSGQYMAMISRLSQHYELSVKGGEVTKRISIRAQTGKVLHYFVRREAPGQSPHSSRVPHAFHLLNHILQKEKLTTARLIAASPPMIISAGTSQMVEHTGNVLTHLHLDHVLSTYMERVKGVKSYELVHDYESLKREGWRQGKNEEEAVEYAYKATCQLVPKTLLKDSFMKRVPDPMHHFALRRMMGLDLGVMGAFEFLLRLSPSSASSIHCNVFTGKCANADYRMDLSTANVDHPVPFRLTRNLAHFLGASVDGHFTWCLSSCMAAVYFRPPFDLIKPLIFDSIALECDKDRCDYTEINRRTDAICAMIKQRINGANEEGSRDSAVELVARARDEGRRMKMPPSWQPWF